MNTSLPWTNIPIAHVWLSVRESIQNLCILSIVQHSTVHYSTVQHSTVQYSIVKSSITRQPHVDLVHSCYNYAEISSLTKKKDRNNTQKHCDVGMMIDSDVAQKGLKTR